MKTRTAFALAAAAALAALAAASPAAAQSRFSVGVTVGNGGYYSPYYGGRYYGYGDYYPYSRAANRACLRDPWCSGSFYDRWGGPFYGPAPVYAPPPVVAYERTERYDPLPRWREIAPREGYREPYNERYAPYYDEPYDDGRTYRYEDVPARAYESAPAYGAAGGDAPVTADGAVRYDLAQRGYAASDFAGETGYNAAADPQYAPPVRYDQIRGGGDVAESFIRTPSQDPDDLLLGGPR